MPRGHVGSCSVCDHPERAAIDLLLMASAAYRNIANKFGVSLRSLSEHRARGHHLEITETADSESSTEGPWVHIDLLRDILDKVMESLPLAQDRVRLLDRIKSLDDRGFFREAVAGDMTDAQLEDGRRLRSGMALVMFRGRPEWFHYKGGAFVQATPTEIALAGRAPATGTDAVTDPAPAPTTHARETKNGTERRNSQTEGASP